MPAANTLPQESEDTRVPRTSHFESAVAPTLLMPRPIDGKKGSLRALQLMVLKPHAPSID